VALFESASQEFGAENFDKPIFKGRKEDTPGPPGIPVLKVKNPPAKCKNSRKFPICNTPLYTLSANINLTNSHHLSIAMSNINSLRLSPSNLTAALSTSRRPRVAYPVIAYLHNKSYVT